MRRLLESWFMDALYSLRRLAARPAYVSLAVLTLALGAGGTAAVISIVRPLLLAPLPVREESRIGILWHPGDWNEAEYLYLRPDFPGFDGMAAYMETDLTLETPGAPLRLLHGVSSTSELFRVLGARPALGRAFEDGEDRPGAEPVAVLSHQLWKDLGGNSSILGTRLKLAGSSRTVVGVMPRGFWFPDPTVQLWVPASFRPENHVGNYTLVGRIAGGGRMDRMQGPLQGIASRLGQQFQYPAQWDKTKAPSITPLREHLVGSLRPSLLATLVAMALILSMACVNVSALMLGQVGGRSTELAVRTALGADRRRLVQQLVVEAVVLGLLAGTLGAFLASLGFGTLLRALPLGPLARAARLDWSLWAAATLLGIVAATAISLVPAIVIGRGNLASAMGGARTGGQTVRRGRLEAGLVIAQVAVAVLLAAGAGLLLKSVVKLRGIDPGVRVERAAVIDATMPTQLSFDERRRAVLELLPALQGAPGVRWAAAAQKIPLRGTGHSWSLAIEGKPELEATTTYFRIVTRDYFKTLGVPIRQGRDFLPTDREGTERVTVINQALAAKYFPNEDPIGHVIHSGLGTEGEHIVGVVANVAEAYLTDVAVPARYVLYEQVPFAPQQVSFVLTARSADALPSVLRAGRATVEREGHEFAVQDAETLQRVFEEAVGASGQVASLLSLLAGVALLLGAIGVYGMISQFVTRRTRDYGIRMALGLPPRSVLSHVLTRGLGLVGMGSAIGILAALLTTRLLSSLLYGVGAHDPMALAAAVLALLLVGSLAALVPARRASRTDPVSVLREE